MPGENHDWHNLDRYLAIHQRCLERSEGYFVVEHDLHWPSLVAARLVQIDGTIRCQGDITIHVHKTLDRDERNRVRGRRYSYNVQLVGPPVVSVFRYDNADHFKGHYDDFHKHVFDEHGNEIAVEHIGRQAWPSLQDVIDEAYEWWLATTQQGSSARPGGS